MASRRIRSVEQRAKMHIAKLALFSVIILAIAAYLGPKALIQLSVFSEHFKSSSDANENGQKHIPPPPKLDPLPEATKNKTLSVAGNAEPQSDIKVFVNDVERGKSQAGIDGSFSVENVRLSAGANKITAISVSGDQESSLSNPIVIWYKDEPPTLEINEPENNTERSGSDKILTIKGRTDPETKLTINDRVVVLGTSGEFEYQITLKDGDNHFKLIARDIADNETTQELTVKYHP